MGNSLFRGEVGNAGPPRRGSACPLCFWHKWDMAAEKHAKTNCQLWRYVGVLPLYGWILELGVWGHVGVARDEPRSLTLPAGIFDRFCARKYIFWVIDMTSPCAWILGLGVWGHVGVARDEPGGLTLPAGIVSDFCASMFMLWVMFMFWVISMISHGGVRGLHWDLGVSTWAGRCHLACRSVSP